MNWEGRIIIDPGILCGKPVVKGTRLAVEFIVDLLAQGWTAADILQNYPGITGVCKRRPSCGEGLPNRCRLMRILANENFPRGAVEALRVRGHDVFWA